MLETLIGGIGQFTIGMAGMLVLACFPMLMAVCCVRFTGSKE